jgi:acetyl-CoA synthetase (ADP-forming)
VRRTLSEAESARRLAAYGIPIVEERLCAGAPDAAAAAAEIGFPVVVKLCGDGIAHKTERGLVRLGLHDAVAVEVAGTELLGLARPDDGPVELLVAPMVSGARELIAGMTRDAQFGPCVMLGVGGVLAEAVADVQIRLAPIDAVDAGEMLEELAHQALLGEFRGEPPVDRESVERVLLGLSAVAAAEPSVVSVDLNPLIVSSADGRVVAVDALVEEGAA